MNKNTLHTLGVILLAIGAFGFLLYFTYLLPQTEGACIKYQITSSLGESVSKYIPGIQDFAESNYKMACYSHYIYPAVLALLIIAGHVLLSKSKRKDK